MLKFLMMLSMLNASLSVDYVNIDKVYHYQNNEDRKQIVFELDTDYYKKHFLNVYISLYDEKDNFIAKYSNSIDVIGKKEVTANIDFSHSCVSYIVIEVFYQEKKVSDNIMINIYKQDDCFLNKYNRVCNRIYKSEADNGVSKDYYTHFTIDRGLFDRFLPYNEFNVETIKFYSHYDFSKGNVYLEIQENIEGFKIFYNDKYRFLLGLNEDLKFGLLDEYYVNVSDFSFSDSYVEGGHLTKNIHLPFNEDYKEYLCRFVIDDFIDIYVDFHLATSDKLFGNCEDSKFCIKRERYG